MSLRPSTNKNRQGGAAAVELALMTLPLILMALAAIEYARMVYQYDIIVKATRDATRILTAFDPSITAEYPVALAKNRVVYQDDLASQPRLNRLTVANVSVCDRQNAAACPGMSFAAVASGSGPVDLVRVQVTNYQFEPMFGAGILPNVTFGPIGTTMRAVK